MSIFEAIDGVPYLKNRYYVIVDTDNVTDTMIEDCLCNSLKDARKSLDGTKVILSYENRKPRSLYGIDKYTHKEILNTIRNNNEWEEEFDG
tara:strand:- start:813 stop:1085 length:273 start_codon:yes stop_codon:yes gene_type:complete